MNKMKCVVPENIHTSPTVLKNPHPPPQEIQFPSVGGVWIFSGTAQYYLKQLTLVHFSK